MDGLSLEIPAGAICAILGPNGAGKSTTLKMLAGLLPPTAGEGFVDGISIRGQSPELKRRIGCLPEDLGLFAELTVEEHLRLTGDVYGLNRGETEARIDRLLCALSLEEGRRTFARSCSQGMRKKTALAMALLPNPKILILDEPFEAIEPATTRAIGRLLQTMAGRGVTILFSSHILPLAERIATQVVILRGGRVALSSAAKELTHPLEDVYFEMAGEPPPQDLEWLGQAQS